MEQEKTNLLKSVEDVKATALSKAGEIAIVRSNHDKTSKEYERRLSVIQKLHAEEIEKQRREVEIARKDRDQVETANKFLEHELVQEAERAKQNRRTLQDRPVNVRHQITNNRQGTVTTPKKSRIAPFRDGFDDDEVVVVSPSKTKQRSKPSTPKAGGKRKRPIEASPVQALDIDGPQVPSPVPPTSGKEPQITVSIDLPLRPASEDGRFRVFEMSLCQVSFYVDPDS